MTAGSVAERAAEVRALRVVDHNGLPHESLVDLLLYGLTDGDLDPVTGVIGAARLDVSILISYVQPWQESDLEAGLCAVDRRLAVAIELLHRVSRATDEAPTPDGAR